MFVPPRADDATAFYIGFDRPLANRMISLYLPVIEQEDPQKSSTVAWEFWNGTEWMALGARDETHDLTQPGMVQFLGPQDFQAKKEFDVLRYWVRARLAQIQQEEKGSKDQGQSKKAKEKLKLAGIIPNAVWGRQGVTIEGEALGTSTGKPDQVFSFSHTPILEGEELEVREPERPSPRQLDELKREAGFDPLNHDGSTPTGGSEIWVRWQPVEHFYLSHPESRHYVLERRMGELRFGNGMQGKIPPAGRDNIRLRRYRVGGGKAANVAAGRITILKRAIPLIAGVNNPYPATAGADGERTEEVMRRGPLRLKHLDRAVTSEDYEWLAREASVQVARARCPLVREESHAGQVAVLIVPDETEAQPFPGPGLRRMVADYIAPRCPAGVVLSVLGPTYVEVSVKASVAPARLEEGDLVRQRILQGLSEFLHPLRGGPDQRGWPFGRDAYLSEVLAFIERIDGVDYVKEAELTGRIALEGLVHTGGVERNVLIGKEARFKSLVPGDQLWLDDTLAYLITKVDSETMPPSVRIDRPVTIAEQHARPLRVTRAISVGATFKSAGGDGSVLQVINAKHAETLYDLMPGDHVWIASIANSHKARTVTGIDVVMGTVTVNPPTELAEGQSTTVALVGGGNRRAQANDDVGELVAAGRHFITIVPSAT
jgi:hypothetical protein